MNYLNSMEKAKICITLKRAIKSSASGNTEDLVEIMRKIHVDLYGEEQGARATEKSLFNIAFYRQREKELDLELDLVKEV